MQSAETQHKLVPAQLIDELINPISRESALAELSSSRESIPDLALLLWTTPCVATILLQEILAIYPLLMPPTLTSQASTRVCNALALMQCIASNTETRSAFLKAQIPNYLYPCLNASYQGRPFEYLRLTCLGVIGALVKNDCTEIIEALLQTEIVPLCLRIMESGNELSRTVWNIMLAPRIYVLQVAIFIVQKILLDDVGLDYICQTYERFFSVTTVLHSMTMQLVEQKSLRLVKHVIRCYLRLSDNKKYIQLSRTNDFLFRALESLRQILPDPLKSGYFNDLIRDDHSTVKFYSDLLSVMQ